MADLKVRGLDERVARVLKSRAAKRGVSLEEEVRSTLSARWRHVETRSDGAPRQSARTR